MVPQERGSCGDREDITGEQRRWLLSDQREWHYQRSLCALYNVMIGLYVYLWTLTTSKLGTNYEIQWKLEELWFGLVCRFHFWQHITVQIGMPCRCFLGSWGSLFYIHCTLPLSWCTMEPTTIPLCVWVKSTGHCLLKEFIFMTVNNGRLWTSSLNFIVSLLLDI